VRIIPIRRKPAADTAIMVIRRRYSTAKLNSGDFHSTMRDTVRDLKQWSSNGQQESCSIGMIALSEHVSS
jgi:hypothetical protein